MNSRPPNPDADPAQRVGARLTFRLRLTLGLVVAAVVPVTVFGLVVVGRLFGADAAKVWELRRAGQGLVQNIPGDNKPREIVEDTAVAVADLPAYIAEFDRLLAEKYGIDCIHYAHAGAGELHLRPLFDLRSPAGLAMFRAVDRKSTRLNSSHRT